MFDFIPLEKYALPYYNFLLVIVLVVYFQSLQSEIEAPSNLRKKQSLGWLMLSLIILYIGFRPVSGVYFGDMARYALKFSDYASGERLQLDKDIFFEYFIKICSNFMTVDFFFLLCAFLYVFPIYLISKKLFDRYWFYAALMLIVSLSFWSYGTNGIRNGLATSFFLWGLSRSNRAWQIAFFTVAVLFHQSLLLPVGAYVLTLFYKNTRMYLYFWILAIPLSLIAGGFFEQRFMSFGFGNEDRLQGYLTDLEEGIVNSKTGFRWDFLMYSATGVLAGWYFIIRKKFDDPIYTQLFNIYLISNGLWILIIKANFSNISFVVYARADNHLSVTEIEILQ
jgi:hypothetical protein